MKILRKKAFYTYWRWVEEKRAERRGRGGEWGAGGRRRKRGQLNENNKSCIAANIFVF